MLSKAQMVRVRKAVESLYEGLCTVTERQPYSRPNKSTGFKEVTVVKDQPCRLSFSSIPAAEQSETGATLQQSIRLFIAPEIDILPGSRITVTQDGRTVCYCRSGQPAVYAAHQEIDLELWKEWT